MPLIGGTVSVESTPLAPGYAPLMKSIFGGSEVPILSHFVISLLVCGSAAWVLATRRVIQVPMPYIAIAWIGFFGLVLLTTAFSAFLFVSIPISMEWAVYGIAGLATIAIVGRKTGPAALLTSLVAGCILLALIGLFEYFVGTEDPSWRIFATWQNPNALAGMLLVGFFVGIGLTLSQRTPTSLIYGAASALNGFALALTQSKGAFVAAAVGLLALFVLALLWSRGAKRALRVIAMSSACVLAVASFLALLRLRPSASPTANVPFARVAQASESQEQSTGFRILLWKSAAKLMQMQPLGWGTGSFRFESARPGLTTQTHLAHNSYLQLGAESGAPSLLLFLGLGVVCIGYIVKGARRREEDVTALRIGVLAAIIAAGAHNVVDSDLHYFGTGISFFMLLGVALQLSADGVTPESVLPVPRWLAFASCIAVPATLFYFGAIEATKAHVRHHMERGQAAEALDGAKALLSSASGDGESWYLRGLMSSSAGRLNDFKEAAARHPSTRFLRAYARALDEAGKSAEAMVVLNKALVRDPNNLITLKLLMDSQLASQDKAGASETARRLVQVEETTYFKTRALPELVPTETYFARKYLSDESGSPREKAELLKPAFDGLLDYAARTVPNVLNAIKAEMAGYAGETPDDARAKLNLGKSVAEDLMKAYRALRDSAAEGGVAAKSSAFDEALAALG